MEASISNQEKYRAAISSVVAGIGLTVFKLVVALMTGSLAMLAETAHSGLDLIAAFTTLIAINISGRPADMTHHYGHGKVESLSALIEMLLLLATSVWVVYEAIQRLLYKAVLVNPSIWAFIVMGVSILVDFSRSRVLKAAAQKYNSQALEADALNYRNDMFSSMITILGLFLVILSHTAPRLNFLRDADSIAAIALAVIIVWIGAGLGKRAIEGLLDRAPDVPIQEILKVTREIPGVIDPHNVRLRASGPDLFLDVHVTMDGDMPLRDVHSLMGTIEEAIQKIIPGADVVIHPEPEGEEHRHPVDRSA